MNTLKSNTKGFTIIEVVLVLAIAGLIFLVVFLALPALQRSQRDQQRKSDLGRMVSQVTAWQGNKQGVLPTSAEWNAGFKSGYLTAGGQKFEDPSATPGTTYTIAQQAAIPTGVGDIASALTAGNIFVYLNASCGGANGVQAGSGGRQFAAVIFQEQGAYTCQNN